MISTRALFESVKPYRSRAEVFILNGDKLMVGQPPKWHGYAIPGGGIDNGETPIQAAQREALEEIGVKVSNILPVNNTPKKINYNTTPPKNTNPKMIEGIKKLQEKYSGALFHTFVGKFDGYDKTLWGKHADSYNVKEISIPEAIQFFQKHRRDMQLTKDIYNYEKAKYVLEVLRKIK